MKQLFFFVIIMLFVGNLTIYAQWQQTSGPEGGTVHCLDDIDGVLWAGTNSGIIKSFDKGETWVHDTLSSSVYTITHSMDEILIVYRIETSDFFHPVGVMRSVDNGQSWEDLASPLGWDFGFNEYDLFRLGDAIIGFDGYSWYVLRDSDTIWTPITVPQGTSRIGHDDSNLIIRNLDTLSISYDKGLTWEFLTLAPSSFLSGPMFLEDSLLILFGFDSIFVSNDLGTSFESSPTMSFLLFGAYEASIRRLSDGCIYYKGDFVIKSCDNGVTWSQEDYYCNDFILVDEKIILATNMGVDIFENNITSPSNSGFIASSISDIDTDNSGNIYIKTNVNNNLLYSDDSGVSWKEFKDDLGNSIYLHNFEGCIGDTLLFSSGNGISYSYNGSKTTVLDTDHYGRELWVDDHLWVEYSFVDEIINYSDDNGASWVPVNLPSGISFKGVRHFLAIGNHWIIDLLIEGGGDQVYISNDLGTSWTLSAIEALYAPIVAGERIFMADQRVSDDFGATMQDYVPIGIPNDGLEKIIDYDSVWYGLTVDRIYISTDYGESWGTYDDAPIGAHISDLVIDNSGQLFLGTWNLGVWVRNGDLEIKSGYTYLDANNNGVADGNEEPIHSVLVNTNQTNAKSNSGGHFSIFVNSTTDSIKASFSNKYATVQPAGYPINSAMDGYDFGVYLEPGHNDLKLDLTNFSIFRPGFGNTLNVTIKNVGTTKLKPTASIVLDDNIEFISAIPTPTSVSGNELNWDLDSLNVMDIQTVVLSVKTKLSSVLGDTVFISSQVLPINFDESPENNVATVSDVILGSFDPNDKKVEPNTNYSPDYLDDQRPLTYTIRFQNTGNYQADNVRIIDTLSEHLDVTSLEIISSSHSLDWTVRSAGVLELLFHNIFLPDSISNEAGSHGFVKYSILPKAGLPLGTPIDNTAYIYFDFNPPIITNTTETKFDHLVGVWSLTQKVNDLDITPNPASDEIELSFAKAESGPAKIKVYDTVGHQVYSTVTKVYNGKVNLSLPYLTSGSYLVRLDINEMLYSGKILIAH